MGGIRTPPVAAFDVSEYEQLHKRSKFDNTELNPYATCIIAHESLSLS
jgi:hypothetical protein